MKTSRGISQVVFNFLPNQTFDYAGRSWKVDRWSDPSMLAVDVDVVRAALRRVIHPWTAHGLDGGLAEKLIADLRVVAPSEDGGVRSVPFPESWYCRKCRRISGTTEAPCACGHARWGQLAFVAYHHCGRLETPWIPRCPEHDQVRVNLPASASMSDLVFDCPICKQVTSRGFPYIKCPCGDGTYSHNLHRAAVVYTARSTVIVNPPSASEAARLKSQSGKELVLEWALRGMQEHKPLEGTPTVDSLIAAMVAQGLDEDTARVAAKAAAAKDDSVGQGTASKASLSGESLELASEAALLLAYATASGRTLVSDLAAQAPPALQPRYTMMYPKAILDSGLEAVELLDEFPVMNAAYGFTRGGHPAGKSALRWFKTGGGSPRIHGQLAKTEALLFRLDPVKVLQWVAGKGHPVKSTDDPKEARVFLLEHARIPVAGEDPSSETLGADLLRLLHSYSHRVMRRISAFAGIDRDSLSEYLIPEHLTFAVYAAARGDFVLGGLQALFEHDLAEALDEIVGGEHRCALDPGCTTHGGACVACLHVGEPSCRLFNQFLDRRVLFGPGGYLS